MLIMIVLMTVIVVGLTAIALAEPRSSYAPRRSDDMERVLLRERKIDRGWW